MTRLLRQLDHVDGGRPARGRGGTDRRHAVTATLLAMILIVVIGGTFGHKHFGVAFVDGGIRLSAPLGTPPAVPDVGGSFAFQMTQVASDNPVTYDPCDPIEYVVNDALAPQGSRKLLTSAIDEISAATGLVFRDAGRTDLLPSDPSALPSRRAPVLVAWTTPGVVGDLAGRVAGVGGSVATRDDHAGARLYVTGVVALDAPQLGETMLRTNGPQQVRAVILHELGHLVGLSHVDDPNELMHHDNVGRLDLGPGDRRGLAALGSGRCFH
jgi:hypothetical protein